MVWYGNIKNDLKKNKVYSHKDMMLKLKSIKPDLSEKAYHWALSTLVKNGQIAKLGYDAYALPNDSPKQEYNPAYSEQADELKQLINNRFPDVKFTVFESRILNDFLNHLIAQNTVFLQIEKESSIFVFRFLQEKGYPNILYKPSRNDFDLYWAKNGIVVTELISEAPLNTDNPHAITLEKMLVDICADKRIASVFSGAELPFVIEQAQDLYKLDKVRLLRYARRRNRYQVMKDYLEGSAAENAGA